MKNIVVIISLIVIVLGGAALLLSSYKMSTDALSLELSQELRQAKLQAAKSLVFEKTALEKAKLQTALRREISAQNMIGFWVEAKKYSLIATVSVGLTAALVIALAWSKRLTTHEAQLDEHTRIPVRHKDLKDAMPLATQFLSVKEAAARAENQQKAFEMFVQMAEVSAALNRSLPRQMLAAPVSDSPALTAAPVPTFRQLLDQGMIAPGKPFIMGFSQHNEPQCRAREDIKALAIAGSQGSGKTYSMAYLISSILCQMPDALVYVIDPHSNHEKSLTALIRPLAESQRLKLINPIDTYITLTKLEKLLDARLNGLAPSEPAIFLVIDEMARLVTSLEDDHLDAFISFLARCTEETRKANITVIGGSVKWKARYFKNRADIREGMDSFLIHKTKPSLADLLLEDAREKKMVKGLTLPGQCVLATSHDADPQVVQMPLITKQDMYEVVRMIGNGGPVIEEYIIKETGETPQETRETSLQERVKLYLETTGISQNEFADSLGISKKEMSYWMNDKNLSEEKKRFLSVQILGVITKNDKTSGNSETPEETSETANETDKKHSKVIPFSRKS